MAAAAGSPLDEKTNLANNRVNVRPVRRLRLPQEERSTDARFFLSKPSTHGSALELGKELSNEGEARVEALKAGLTYYSLQEWRPVADFAGRNPELKREPVMRKSVTHDQE